MSSDLKQSEAITRAQILVTSTPTRPLAPLSTHFLLTPSQPDGVLLTEFRPAQPPTDHKAPIKPRNSHDFDPEPLSLDLDPPPSPVPLYSRQDDAWTHIASIYHNADNKEICESAYLALKDLDVQFYLPQLCLLLIHVRPASDVVERLVLDHCASSLLFAIRSIFFIGALAPTSVPNPNLAERIENYQYACQLSYINNSRPHLDENANPVDSSPTLERATSDPSSKDLRFKYLSSMKRFLRELSEVDEITHVADLRRKLAELNQVLRQSATLPRESAKFLPGLFLPLSTSRDRPYAILKIPEHEAILLPSKNRVPFYLCIETLSIHHSSDGPLDAVIDFYSNVIQQLLATENWRERGSSPIFTPTSSSPSPTSRPTSPIVSADSLQLRSSSPRPTSPSIPPSRALEESTPPSQLQHLMSVPQNTTSIRTREKHASKEARIREHSVYGPHENWRLRSVIVKYGLDGLQEQLSLQILRTISSIFSRTPGVRAKCLSYDCQVLEGEACLIEPLLDAESIHQIKKNNNMITLHEYFVKKWNGPDSEEFLEAQREFLATLAGSSVASYVLQLKDRHNANIMINDRGSVAHIDWGFLLWNSPGAIGFESAPFKLTSEMVSVLGGPDSPLYSDFKSVFHDAFMALRNNAHQIIDMVTMMFMCDEKRVPCSVGGSTALESLKNRLALSLSDSECLPFTHSLVDQSFNNWRTLNYDYYQYYTNGILS